MGNAGGSADEHAKRLIEEAGAWAAGAEGERRVAAALEVLPAAWTVVHDRLLRPGRSEANLDHIVVGPGGVFLVDAKNRAGNITEYEGGLFQHRTRGGVRESVSLAAELRKIHGMATYMAVETDARVAPVHCLAGAHEKEFGEPRMVRGVWVVPVSRLATWLGGRPVVLSPDEVIRTTTRVITDFPSTTTDPALLAAMGQAATRQPSSRRVRPQPAQHARPRATARVKPRTNQPLRRFVSIMGRLVIMGLALTLVLVGIGRLPDILSWLAAAAHPGVSVPSPGAATGGEDSAAPDATSTRTATKKATAIEPPAPPDCADASAAEIKAIIKRTVKPVAVSTGCAWGTRLDDRSALLVTIVMSPEHAAYDADLVTSVRQKRVVFGSSFDSTYRPATKASVALGQPIIKGKKPVRARADTEVVVATQKLGISDDRARQMAVAIAAAANAGG